MGSRLSPQLHRMRAHAGVARVDSTPCGGNSSVGSAPFPTLCERAAAHRQLEEAQGRRRAEWIHPHDKLDRHAYDSHMKMDMKLDMDMDVVFRHILHACRCLVVVTSGRGVCTASNLAAVANLAHPLPRARRQGEPVSGCVFSLPRVPDTADTGQHCEWHGPRCDRCGLRLVRGSAICTSFEHCKCNITNYTLRRVYAIRYSCSYRR